jgi:hypothetical protein
MASYANGHTDGVDMAPVATHDTHRTAIPQSEPIVNEKRGMFGRRQHAKPVHGSAPRADEQYAAPGPYGHSFKFGSWLK